MNSTSQKQQRAGLPPSTPPSAASRASAGPPRRAGLPQCGLRGPLPECPPTKYPSGETYAHRLGAFCVGGSDSEAPVLRPREGPGGGGVTSQAAVQLDTREPLSLPPLCRLPGVCEQGCGSSAGLVPSPYGQEASFLLCLRPETQKGLLALRPPGPPSSDGDNHRHPGPRLLSVANQPPGGVSALVPPSRTILPGAHRSPGTRWMLLPALTALCHHVSVYQVRRG